MKQITADALYQVADEIRKAQNYYRKALDDLEACVRLEHVQSRPRREEDVAKAFVHLEDVLLDTATRLGLEVTR